MSRLIWRCEVWAGIITMMQQPPPISAQEHQESIHSTIKSNGTWISQDKKRLIAKIFHKELWSSEVPIYGTLPTRIDTRHMYSIRVGNDLQRRRSPGRQRFITTKVWTHFRDSKISHVVTRGYIQDGTGPDSVRALPHETKRKAKYFEPALECMQ